MGSRRSPSAPQWQVILEEIRSQNRVTLEELLSFRQSIEERVDRLDRESRGRDEVLALAVRALQQEVSQHSSDLTELKRLAFRHGSDIAELKRLGERHDGRLAALEGLGERHDGRLTALEALGERQDGRLATLESLGERHEARFSSLEALSEREDGRLGSLEGLGRQHGVDLRDLRLSVQENTLELKALAQKVEALHRLDERVAALERKVDATPPSA
jgi:DNA repair ATPase RecN